LVEVRPGDTSEREASLLSIPRGPAEKGAAASAMSEPLRLHQGEPSRTAQGAAARRAAHQLVDVFDALYFEPLGSPLRMRGYLARARV